MWLFQVPRYPKLPWFVILLPSQLQYPQAINHGNGNRPFIDALPSYKPPFSSRLPKLAALNSLLSLPIGLKNLQRRTLSTPLVGLLVKNKLAAFPGCSWMEHLEKNHPPSFRLVIPRSLGTLMNRCWLVVEPYPSEKD